MAVKAELPGKPIILKTVEPSDTRPPRLSYQIVGVRNFPDLEKLIQHLVDTDPKHRPINQIPAQEAFETYSAGRKK